MPLPKDKKLTFEDLKKMSTDEINERWDEVTKVLEASGDLASAESTEDDDADE